MNDILSLNLKLACGLLFFISLYLVVRFRKLKTDKNSTVSNIAFFCILFTSGLDIGLIMFPLMEFKQYTSPDYLNINPLSLEIGFWGGAVWLFYFVTTFYFVYLEPKIRVFDSFTVKVIMAILMLLTCAFTAKLFVSFFKFYMPSSVVQSFPELFTHGKIVFYTVVILTISAVSAMHINFIKIISFLSIVLFIGLISVGIIINVENYSLFKYIITAFNGIYGYIFNIDDFVVPMNDYHQFYMYWWFSWSLMIGKFVASYVPKNTTPIKLFFFMLIVPTIPLTLWFTVLYLFYVSSYGIPLYFLIAMSFVGILFVINSFDSILRVSSDLLKSSIKTLSYNKCLSICYLLLIVFFIGYTGISKESEGFIKIDYTGTLSIIFLYYLIYICFKNNINRCLDD